VCLKLKVHKFEEGHSHVSNWMLHNLHYLWGLRWELRIKGISFGKREFIGMKLHFDWSNNILNVKLLDLIVVKLWKKKKKKNKTQLVVGLKKNKTRFQIPLYYRYPYIPIYIVEKLGYITIYNLYIIYFIFLSIILGINFPTC